MDRLADAVEKTMRGHPGIFSAVVSAPDGSPAMQYQSAYAGQEICTRERMTEEELEKNKASFVKPFDIREPLKTHLRENESSASNISSSLLTLRQQAFGAFPRLRHGCHIFSFQSGF